MGWFLHMLRTPTVYQSLLAELRGLQGLLLEQGLKFTVCVISAHLLKYSIFSGLFFVLDSGWGVCPNLDAWVSAAVSECDISGGQRRSAN